MRSRRLARWVTATLLCGSLGAALAQDLYRPEGQWLDDRGLPYKLESLHGTATVMTMAYGACRRICSTSLSVMQRVQALADERQVPLNFVVVGLDPAQDKPADWAGFRADRKLNRPNWQFLSGDEASTRQLAGRLGVHYWRYGEHTMHDFRIVLLSPDGWLLHSMDEFGESPATLLPSVQGADRHGGGG